MPKRLKIGDIIDGKYTIVEAFEPGGMGLVFKVRSTEGKVRALKVCRETEDDDVRRFKREVRIMKKIKHPNVITVVDDNLDHDPPYFVMCLARASLASESAEYVDDEQRVLDALEQICKGLQAIHNSDVVHRDIKPANALVLKDGTIVVADLGLSKLNDRDSTILTMSRAIVGTEAYLAPEQRMPKGSREADQRTDIYQVGKTLYELLTGRNPAFIDVSDVPPGLARIIKRSTREDPSERYQTVGELMDALASYKLSKDPKRNIAASIGNSLELVEDGVRRGTYNRTEVSQLLFLFLEADQISDEVFMELIDKVSPDLLTIMASELSEILKGVLDRYVRCLTDTVGGRVFSYAEGVASRMKAVFRNTALTEVKALAFEAMMVAAVKLNRFAAITVVNNILRSIKDDATAYAVADVLKHHKRLYAEIAEHISPDQLHAAVQVVQASVLVK